MYRIEAGASLPTLHQSLIGFTTDVTFGYSIYSAYQGLSRQGQGNATQKIDDAPLSTQRATTAQCYSIKFGNPFPGPSHEVAHHCVDLIYIFDAFHDDLEAQDGQSPGHVAAVSNAALRQDIQSTWVDFIVGDAKNVREGVALVYGKDRIARMENLHDDPEWVEQRRKLDWIGAHRQEAAAVLDKVFALAR